MIPAGHQARVVDGTWKFDEIMEKLEIVINDMMADDGPVPLDLRNVGTHDARTAQSDQDAGNDMSYHDARAIAWKE